MLKLQSYKNFECLIVDDGSRDKTRRLYRNFCESDSRFILCDYEPRQNVGFSREYGIRQAKGVYAAILDHDDFWSPEKLERQVRVMESDRSIDLIYTKNRSFIDGQDSDYKAKQPATTCSYQPNLIDKISRGNFIACDSIMIRLSSEKKIQGFVGNKGLKHCEDYYSILRYALYGKIARIDQTLTYIRAHANSKSQSNSLALAECLNFIAEDLVKSGYLVFGRRIKAQSLKTRANYYYKNKDINKSYQLMLQSYRFDQYPRSLMILILCWIKNWYNRYISAYITT